MTVCQKSDTHLSFRGYEISATYLNFNLKRTYNVCILCVLIHGDDVVQVVGEGTVESVSAGGDATAGLVVDQKTEETTEKLENLAICDPVVDSKVRSK